MPAIITHDTFGQDVTESSSSSSGARATKPRRSFWATKGPTRCSTPSRTCASPRRTDSGRSCTTRCPTRPSSPSDAASQRCPADRSIGRAYVMGFICHYLLDSTVHPFVYSQQYALCDAGVEGLDRKAGSDVHAVIESEIDEVVLNVKRGETIATFNPSKRSCARATIRSTSSPLFTSAWRRRCSA